MTREQRIRTALILATEAYALLQCAETYSGNLFGEDEHQLIDDAKTLLFEAGVELYCSDCVPEPLDSAPEYPALRGLLDGYFRSISTTDAEALAAFTRFHAAYASLGKKRGLDTEWADFKRKHRDYRTVALLLPDRLAALAAHREALAAAGQFVEGMAHMKTWLSNRRWEDTLPTVQIQQHNGNSTHTTTQGNKSGNRYTSAVSIAEERKRGVADLSKLSSTLLQSLASQDGE